MTEVGHTDLSRILQARRNECTSIVTSRKRKLRELFAVASHTTNLPEHGFASSDAPAATPAEWQFLCAADIVQGRKLDESKIPARPKLSLDLLRRQRAEYLQSAISRRGPPDARSEASIPDAFATKSKGFLPPAIKSPAPVSPTKAVTSIASSRHSSARGALPPQQVLEPDAKLVYFSDSTRKDAEEADSTTASATSRVEKKDSVVKRPAHVKFPPGTKGSPSADSSLALPTDANATNLSDSGTNGISETRAAHARSESNLASLSIKLPSEASRVPEILSTPGSTAPSATTPAVHDASTDTSPDRDGPRYLDTGSSKESSADSEVHSQASRASSQEQAPSAEDQLLYESMQSSVSAKQEAVSTTAMPSQANYTTNPAENVAPVTNVPRVRPTSSTAVQLPSTEVLESQEYNPKTLDADARKIKPEADQHILPTSREPNLAPARDLDRLSPNPRTQAEGRGLTLERAVTRVSSGAIRRKSVNEIVGSLSRLPAGAGRDVIAQGVHHQPTTRMSMSQSPTCRARDSASARKERVKNHVASTVLFGKQPTRVEDRALISSRKEAIQASDDYYTPLFVQNFAGTSKWMQPLDRILFQANKTISTPDAQLVIQDHQACRVLRRVYHLQQHDKWSLRQPKRSSEPIRPRSQWDTMLQEMKWMRTDFREERKWKIVVARNLAYACAEWHRASATIRKSLRVETTIPPKWPTAERRTAMVDAAEDNVDSQSTPDLVPSGDGDSPQNVDELMEDFGETVSPLAIFALHEDDVVFGLDRTAASEKLLMELPIYGSPLKVPVSDAVSSDSDPDAHWRRPALPLSKYVEGEMKLATRGVPTMRSRFDYSDEDTDDKDSQFALDQLTVRLLPITDEVALFQPESKHVRDRLHAGHQFRPPSEHPMPTQSFYEVRSPSQWTVAEDDELRGLVREYSYNWSLISSMLSTRSSFVAGAERRTPWECFERWIILEGLPTDMQKTQYFRTYNHRIEAAQRVILQQNQLAAQQASASGGAVTPVRRRPSTPVRVERRRNQKHLTMLDAMRKLAKKRETVMQKQQHSASQGAASKKNNESLPNRHLRTPKDYSLMRWERDQALAEKMAQYAQRQESQRRANLHARQGQVGQVAGAAGAGMQSQSVSHHVSAGANMNGAARPMSNHMVAAAAAAGQGRPRMAMQAPANGVGVGGVQVQMNGSLAAPSQIAGAGQTQVPAAQGQHRLPIVNQAPDPNLMLRAQRISEQQRAAVQIQQAQAQQQQVQQQVQQQQYHHQPQQQMGNSGTSNGTSRRNSPPMRNGMNGVGQQPMMNNAQAMRGSYASPTTNGSGINASQVNGLHMPAAANVSSPASRPHPQLPPAIAAQLAHLESSFRNKTPSLTSEQVRQLAMEQLTRNMMALRQNHPNSAAGATAQSTIAASLSPTTQASLASSLSPTTQPGIPSSLAPTAQSGILPGLGSPGPSSIAPSLPSTAQSSLASGLPSTSSPHQYAVLLRQQQQQQQQAQPNRTQQQQQQHAQQHFQPHQHLLQQQHHHHHHHQHQHQRQHGQQAKAPPPSHFQQHTAAKQGTPAPPASTPTVASASPVPAQQRVSNSSATPSVVGK